MRRTFAGLFMVICVAGLVSGQPKDKDKVKPGKEVPTVPATIVKVDVAKRILTVTIKGKTVDLPVGKDVKFIGPQGGKATIKDKRLKPGVILGLVIEHKGFVVDHKTLKEVHIPTVMRTKDKEKDKGKSKDKDKK